MTSTGIILHKHNEQKQQTAYYAPVQLGPLPSYLIKCTPYKQKIKYHLYKLQLGSHLKFVLHS